MILESKKKNKNDARYFYQYLMIYLLLLKKLFCCVIRENDKIHFMDQRKIDEIQFYLYCNIV